MALTLPVAEMPEVTPGHQVMAEVAAEAVIAEAAAAAMMTVRSIRKPEAVM